MAEPLETPCDIAIYRGQSGFLDPSTPFKPLSEERGKKRPSGSTLSMPCTPVHRCSAEGLTKIVTNCTIFCAFLFPF
jgi:hypothetical protein